ALLRGQRADRISAGGQRPGRCAHHRPEQLLLALWPHPVGRVWPRVIGQRQRPDIKPAAAPGCAARRYAGSKRRERGEHLRDHGQYGLDHHRARRLVIGHPER
ncbi:unnamed protein product, partial [Laminaria digitata]